MTSPRVVTGLTAVCILLGAIMAWQSYELSKRPQVKPANPTVAIEAPISATVKAETKKPVILKTKTVQAFPASVKGSLKLPKSIQDNLDLQVVAASTLPSNDHPQEVTTVLNTTTGETSNYYRELPLPWVALNFHGEAGIYHGLKSGYRVTRLEVRQTLFQVKAIHVQAVGSLDQYQSGPIGADHFIGIGAVYRW